MQVEEHDSRESSWFVYEGKVYDATKFLNDHPGGPESILIVAGQVRPFHPYGRFHDTCSCVQCSAV